MHTYRECAVPNLLSLSSLYTFSRQLFTRDYHFVGESHDFIEVVCVVEGEVGVTAGKEVHILSAGQMIVHPAGEFHAIWSDRGSLPECIIFSFRAERFPSLPRYVYNLSPSSVDEIKELYSQARVHFFLHGEDVAYIQPHAETAACILLKRLELFLLNAFSADFVSETKYVSPSAENYTRILSAMERNLGEKTTAESLAAECNVSVPTLERTVNRYLGCGAMRYYNQLKMQRAEKLLAQGVSVKEVALALGFSNQNYFSACYKKWAGKPPSYRSL